MELTFSDWLYDEEFSAKHHILNAIKESVVFSQEALAKDPYATAIQDYWQVEPQERSKYRASYDQAIGQMFTKYYPAIKKFLRMRRLDAETAEELASQVFTWVVERWGKSPEEEQNHPQIKGASAQVTKDILNYLKSAATTQIADQKRKGGLWDDKVDTLSTQGSDKEGEGMSVSAFDLAAAHGSKRGSSQFTPDQALENKEIKRALMVALGELKRRNPEAWWIIKKQYIDKSLYSDEYGGFGGGGADRGYEDVPKDMDMDQILSVEPSQVGRGMKDILLFLWDQWDKHVAGQPNKYPMNPNTGKPLFLDKNGSPPGWHQIPGSLQVDPEDEYGPEEYISDPIAASERIKDKDKFKVAIRKLARMSVSPTSGPTAMEQLRSWWGAELGMDEDDIQRKLKASQSSEQWAKHFSKTRGISKAASQMEI